MATVRMTTDAASDFEALPTVIKARVQSIIVRLASWPNVSGAKPLRGDLAGHFRIRAGDWRVLVRPVGAEVVIIRIQNRRDAYED